MSDDSRVDELLEELLNSGRTPEEVCQACPEFLPRVRSAWQHLRALEAEVGAWFPNKRGADDANPGAGRSYVQPAGELPRVLGYEVQGVLGRGGVGVVYQARHVRLNRPVALKMLLAGAYAVPEELERFLREAEAVAGLRHPNIVQVYDIGDIDGRPYFTMELVEGGSLAKKLAGTPEPARRAAALVSAMAGAVHAAHLSGIVHRDLKPANVLLTADGTPKVTDFGLARRLEGGGGLTLSGAPLGTPSYMAPEQARGDKAAIGPATDIYALGAILYECLTGRPPFRAETPAATLQQVLADEPVPPVRLNPRVPRDLDTICLKCLHKEPSGRYATATALVEDLRRFERREPIAARPLGRLGRVLRWARRRPARATALAAGVLLALSLGGIGVWWYQQRSAAERAATNDVELQLGEAVRLRQKLDFANSAEALKRARLRLGDQGPAALQDLLTRESQNLNLVTRLDAIRLEWMYSGIAPDITLPPKPADGPAPEGPEAETRALFARKYEQVFREAGLGAYGDDPPAVAARVATSPVRDALLAALDDWAVSDVDLTRAKWVLTVARLADPDPWRDRVRDLDALEDDAVIKELAAQADMDRQPTHLLLLVSGRLELADQDPRPFLRRVLLAHPADFWANAAMGYALSEKDPVETIGCYRTALAVRPDIGPIHAQLGHVYQRLHRPVEAIHHLERALGFDRRTENLTFISGWRCRRPTDRSRPSLISESARLNPSWAITHRYLGDALLADGRLGEAVEEYRAGLRGDNPRWTLVRDRLRDVLWERGRVAEFRQLWHEALPTKSGRYDVWDGYAELCLFLGDEAGYRDARRDLLKQFEDPVLDYIAGRTGLACLMLPASEHEFQQATALIDRALAADREKYAEYKNAYPSFLFARGLADYRQGQFERAAAAMEAKELKVLGPTPALVAAMARYRLGQKELARQALAAAVGSYDWGRARALDRDALIAHILRREAEGLILRD